MTLNVSDITTVHSPRYQHIVAQYVQRLNAGEALPPILVSRDSRGRLAIVEGNHRLAAHRLAGRTTIEAYIYSVN